MNKKTITAVSIVLGAALAASAAFADALAGNGYYTIKEAIKKTSAHISSGELSNFTVSASLTLSADDSEKYKTESTTKYDGEASETVTSEINLASGETDYRSINYTTQEQTIRIHTDNGKEYATIYENTDKSSDSVRPMHNDPFEEEEFRDLEKVIDAGVGNLKDAVFVEENQNGKMYYGSVDNAQIPVFINALSSFLMKYSLFDEYQIREYGLPQVRDNISVTKASGKAFENEEGLLTEAIGSLEVSGTDKNGKNHTVTISISFAITDIGITDAVEPDLSGAEVQYVDNTTLRREKYVFDEKYVGTYHADIVEVIDNKFVKIGEKRLTITESDGESLAGTFEKTYTSGEHENLYFDFTSFNPNSDDANERVYSYNDIPIKYTNSAGEEEHGIITNNYYGNDNEAAMLMLTLGIEFMEGGGYRHNGGGSFSLTRVMQ